MREWDNINLITINISLPYAVARGEFPSVVSPTRLQSVTIRKDRARLRQGSWPTETLIDNNTRVSHRGPGRS